MEEEEGGAVGDALAAKYLQRHKLALLAVEGAVDFSGSAGAEIVGDFEAGGEAGPGPSLADALYALVHSLRGDLPPAEPYFARVLADYAKGQAPALHVAWVYAVQNKLDAALTVLERGVVNHDPTLLYIKVVPFLENLRPHPGFQSILQRLAL